MKNLFVLVCLAAAATFAFSAINSYTVDNSGSQIVWNASKVTGTHTGTVSVQSGKLDFAEGKLVGGDFTIDMTSITCTDLEGEWRDKLVGHLKSDDFFGVATYPTAKFVITRAIPVDTKGNYRIVGDITIKGKTQEVKFNAFAAEVDGQANANAKLILDRTDFDVRYGSGSFFDDLGDKTIYDEFDLEISLVTK
jgi:polyisoprenoid-binding protein YceI